MGPKTAAEIFYRVRRTLRDAENALADFLTNPSPPQQRSSLRNFVVYGRTVTFVLQKLRSVVSDFNEWYEPIRAEMKNDPLLQFFKRLRSEILKEGEDKVATAVHIRLSMPRDISKFGPPPPGATGFFIGDGEGGSGWIVRAPDGTETKHYVEVPDEIAEVSFMFDNPPQVHLGVPISDCSPANLCKLYLAYLTKIVNDAQRRFGANRE